MAAVNAFARRHRQTFRRSLRRSALMLMIGAALVAVTAAPVWLLWWDVVWPAAIASAIFVLLLFAVLAALPFDAIAYVSVFVQSPAKDPPFDGFRSGRALYREADRLDAMARDAGLTPLCDFESPDVLDTGEPPQWHRPEAALPTVEYLLGRVDSTSPVHRDLRHLHAGLRSAIDGNAGFYLVVLAWSDMTNAEIHARRHGDLS
jgi:hypothetical protein